jgi:hypothetical protein
LLLLFVHLSEYIRQHRVLLTRHIESNVTAQSLLCGSTIAVHSLYDRCEVKAQRLCAESICNAFYRFASLRKCLAIAIPPQHYRCSIARSSLCHRYAIVMPSVCHRCAIAAPSLRHRCAIAAPSLRYRCAIAALSKRNRCSIEAQSLLYRSAIAVHSLKSGCAIEVQRLRSESTGNALHRCASMRKCFDISMPLQRHRSAVATPSVRHRYESLLDQNAIAVHSMYDRCEIEAQRLRAESICIALQRFASLRIAAHRSASVSPSRCPRYAIVMPWLRHCHKVAAL